MLKLCATGSLGSVAASLPASVSPGLYGYVNLSKSECCAVLSYPDEVGFLVAAELSPLGVPIALHGVVRRFLAGGRQGGHELRVERAPSLAHIAVGLAEIEADDAPLQLVFQPQVYPCGLQRLALAETVLVCKLPCEAHQLV